SIRKYTEEEIPEDKLQKILQAGLLAPTSRNKRPWEYHLVRDPQKLEQLSKAKWHGSALLAGAKAAIAVFADSDLSDAWIEDSSIALAYMDLMASSQGVGSCWIQMRMRKDQEGADAEDNVRSILGIDLPYRIVGILALGMPAEEREAYDLDELMWDKVHQG
ncbi:MAG: nitroreductase family protein, partial [Firmicutes bacterium]|nr:nitroreductase family protein [Bacillota bacterium]